MERRGQRREKRVANERQWQERVRRERMRQKVEDGEKVSKGEMGRERCQRVEGVREGKKSGLRRERMLEDKQIKAF